MKDIYIADLANFDEGKLFDGFFLVLAKQQRTTKTNKPYLNLILGDKTGQLEGRVWAPDDPRIARDFERGDIVKARGSASRFDDRLQMKVDQLRKALQMCIRDRPSVFGCFLASTFANLVAYLASPRRGTKQRALPALSGF